MNNKRSRPTKAKKMVSEPVKKTKSEDSDISVSSIFTYIFDDILKPLIKDGLYDIIVNAASMRLYGTPSDKNMRGNSRSNTNTNSRTSYSAFYENGGSRNRPSSRRPSNTYNYDNTIVIASKTEADDILSHMIDITRSYGIISVAYYYDLLGEKSNYIDENYGWSNIDSATVVATRGGYLIRLPKAMPID